ncbi:MAG TPA: hypothetical protein VFB66_14935 [Tepidisphaeraceae bacterium]|nr:hypothetical protein [Tepidisphaeraceae bacterium]
MVLENFLDWVVPDPHECRRAAERLRAEYAGQELSDEELAKRAVASARRWAAGAGAATGAAANPLIAIPAAMADMAAVLKIEGTMAGTVAALLDPASLDDANTFQVDVLTIVFPGAISQALRQLGVRWGQKLTKDLIRKHLTEGLLKAAARVAKRYLFLHVTEKAIVSKTVPIVGAGIGAGWNWLELKAVGNRAIRYYQRKGIGPSEGRSRTRERIERIKSVASRVLPKPKRRLPPAELPGEDLPGEGEDAA